MRVRKDDDSEHSGRFKSALLNAMQGFDKNPGVLLIATTNLPESIDDAFARRFQERFLVRLPNKEERQIILKKYLKMAESSCIIQWDDIPLEYFVAKTFR